MDNSRSKWGLVILVGLGLWALSKKEKPESKPNGTVSITIFDSEGHPVLAHSPAIVDEGATYTVVITVTNTTTWGGTPYEATLDLRVRAAGDGATFIPVTDTSELFAAGEIRSYSYTMSIPLGVGGGIGDISAVVSHGFSILATASEPLTITAIAPVYGATVGITV